MEYSVLAMSYAAGGAVTGGHLYRNGPKGGRGLVVNAAMTVLWPLYWVLAFGVLGTADLLISSISHILVRAIDSVSRVLSALMAAVKQNEELISSAYVYGAVLTSGIYIFHGWDTVSGITGWIGILVRSMLWGAVWPAYWVGAVTA